MIIKKYKTLHNKRKHFNIKYKNRILKILDGEIIACAYCGCIVEKSDNCKRQNNTMTVDHIIPISKGGKPNDIDNVLISCHWCNVKKKNKVVDINTIINNLNNLPVYITIN